MRSHSVTALAVLLGVGFAVPAKATVTASNITAPADGTYYLVTQENPPNDVQLTGTSNGTTGDAVDIHCYDRANDWVGNAHNNIAVQADGSFSTMISKGDPYGSCILRAVPHGFSEASDPSAFSGPTLTNEWNFAYTASGGPNDGKAYDYYVLFQGPNAMNDWVSATRGGLYDSRLQYSPGHASAYLWYENGSLRGNEQLSTNNRSALQVDGRNAYGPATAHNLFPNNAGVPALTYDASRDAATGNTTIHEVDPIVVCPSETPFPPDAGACPHFDSAGVQLERTWFTDDGGLQVHMTDTFRSTDNNQHTLSVHYAQYVAAHAPADGSVPVGLKLPWLGDFKTFSTETVFPGPGPGQGSIFVRDNNGAPDGSETFPVGAITFDTAPSDVPWRTNQVFWMRDENVVVPAGGTAVVRMDYVIGQTQAAVDAKAAAGVDRFVAPTVAISSPANASSITGATSTRQITVTGSASDNVGIASLTLNGAAVTLAGDGTFSAPVTLALGSNTITAVAKDAAGNSTTATVTASYADNAAPAITGFTAAPRTFRVASGPTAISARAAAGTKFVFSLSEDAAVSINIASALPGRRSGKRCVKPTRRLARKRSCVRLVSRGTLRRALHAGRQTVKFSGRIGTRKLPPGRYVATITARDQAGNTSSKKAVTLRIVRR